MLIYTYQKSKKKKTNGSPQQLPKHNSTTTQDKQHSKYTPDIIAQTQEGRSDKKRKKITEAHPSKKRPWHEQEPARPAEQIEYNKEVIQSYNPHINTNKTQIQHIQELKITSKTRPEPVLRPTKKRDRTAQGEDRAATIDSIVSDSKKLEKNTSINSSSSSSSSNTNTNAHTPSHTHTHTPIPCDRCPPNNVREGVG